MTEERMTLREAAERTSRSITTLRRYIRGGRLRAEKRHGRFGPEYYVTAADLQEAGLEPATDGESSTALAAPEPARPPAPVAASPRPPAPVAEGVPISLFQELQMKHEQLLVQYGMVRAGGLKLLELQAELDEHKQLLADRDRQLVAAEERAARETRRLTQQLRQARLELEARTLELGVLREKVRSLEMLSRNAVQNESIETQYRAVMLQARRVGDLSRSDWNESSGPPDPSLEPDLDH